MSKEEDIEAGIGWLTRIEEMATEMSSLRTTIEVLNKRIEELEAERRWIPITERLPNRGDHVLVVRPDSPTTVRKIHFIMWSEDDESDFSHWMSCPDFPKAPQ